MSPTTTRKRTYKLSAAIGMLAASTYLVYGIFISTNSTASIGFIFLPFAAAVGAACALALCFTLFYFQDLFQGRQKFVSKQTLGVLALITFTVYWTVDWKRERALKHMASNPSAPVAELEKLVDSNRMDLIVLVAANPAAPTALLDKIAAGPIRYDRLGAVAAHPALSRQVMERIVNARRDTIGGDVEYRLFQNVTLTALIRNPNLPQDLFDKIAAWPQPEFHLVVGLAYSPRSTCEQLSRFLSTDNDVLFNTVRSQMTARGCRISE